MGRNGRVRRRVVLPCLVVVLLCGLTSAAVTDEPGAASDERSAPAERASPFADDGGFSLRVEFARDTVRLKRTDLRLPSRAQRVMPAWLGAALPALPVRLPGSPVLAGVERPAWDHQVARYRSDDAVTRVLLSRLTPAVVFDSTGRWLAFEAAQPGSPVRFAAWPTPDGVRAVSVDQLGAAVVEPSEPWLLVWFGSRTPYRGYREPLDLDDPHQGAGFARRPHPGRPLDVPLLVRLERRPRRVRFDGQALRLEFASAVGKLAVLPVFGGRTFEPQETESWVERLPEPVVAQCRRWARLLRDVPLTVAETCRVDLKAATVEIQNRFQWWSFQDDWSTPPVKAAPLPPLLALALGGGVPVRFFRDGRPVQPVDDGLMDTPGLAMSIPGADQYTYRIDGLSAYLQPRRASALVVPEAKKLQRRLEEHVRDLVQAGHLAPLLFIHGGIGGARPGYFYWGRFSELAVALAAAFPYLSSDLQQQVRRYLLDEWHRNPPLQVDPGDVRRGTNRAPYPIPWDDIGRELTPALNRERRRRAAGLLGELYGLDAFLRLTDAPVDASALRRKVQPLVDQLLQWQDWALHAPVRPHSPRVELLTGGSWYDRNGQAALNSWLAGTIGLARLARRFNWHPEEELAWYLFAKLAVARVGQARYTAELHRRGLVRGPASADWRTLVHVDRRCALVLRGDIKPVVREDQELPPFIDLTEEVGRLLGAYARDECRIYLDHLDRSMPLWHMSEAPKQSASEQRVCPLLHKSGNVLAQYWVLGRRGEAFRRYVDTTRFRGDLYYVQNLAALIASYADEASTAGAAGRHGSATSVSAPAGAER